jgi:hypothetical protein
VPNLSSRNIKAILSVSALLLGMMYIGGCVNSQSSVSPSKQPRGISKGISLTPLSFQSNDFPDFFEKAKRVGDIVSWAGDWNELINTNNGPKVVVELAATYNYTPLIELQFFTQSTGALLRPLNDAAKEAYKNNAVAFTGKYKLKYLGIGIEVNTLWAKSPADFDAFVQLYNDVYDAIKAKSPDTKVFIIFQLEMMKGLNGGLFGGNNDPAKAQWSLLDKFAKSDLIAFTTYPCLIYHDPSEIPLDYYSEIRTHTEKPIAFTEIGWHSEAGPPGWESSDSEQADFIIRFWALSQNLKEELAIWSFMYDQDTVAPFRSMGLYRRDGTVKPAWNAWLNSG